MEPGATVPTDPPPIVIDGVRVRGEPRPISALGERFLSLAALSPQQNQLEIDFVGLSFESGESLRYQYKLGDAEWSPLEPGRSVTFASLGPGRYQFLVRAANSEGVVSPEPATLTFTILSPIWLRWWFLSLAAAALVLAIHGLYRRRLARLLEIADMRMRIATDLHDDIGADLTRIVLLSEVARQTHAAVFPAAGNVGVATADDDALQSIARIARESVASMGDIVWAINPRRETLVDLTRRMRQHADELFTARGIELRFDTPPAARNPRLGVDVRRDLLLVFKEAVSNAAKHSACSVVVITLTCDAGRLTLEVVDDGGGFDPSADAGDGHGCPSMRRRAERLNGSLTILSSKGKGTTVRLVIPL
jgi:signal transduction histidine kinase